MGSRLVAWLIALLVVVGLAAAGIYLYRQQQGGPPPEIATGEGAKPASPGEPKPAETGGLAKRTAVPSFDVVRIEPTGEGVIAGRAEPGWTVRVESGGTVFGEATADEEGAWSIVLDTPLSAGDHVLALRAYSPDGTRALTAQEPVRVAVGKAEGVAPSEQAAAEVDLASQPHPVVPDETAPRERGTPPVKIESVEYQDKGEDSGTISLSGIGQPNVQVYLFYDDQPLGEFNVGEDGTWTFEVEKRLDDAEHTIRADTYDEKTRVVQGRASVRLGRERQAPAALTAEGRPEAAPAAPAVAEAGALSGQPQPVYPEETTVAEAAPAAPQDLSSQPQPVYPEEATVAEAAPAAPQDLSSQPQPVYPKETAAPEATAEAPQPEAAKPTGPRGQPEPVYPDGAPEMAAAPSVAPQQAAPEPYDLSSQPQPVVPEETAAEESARKLAAETPAEPPQAEAVPAEPVAPAVTAERPTEEAPAPKEPPVVFKSVDYQDKDSSGTVSITGTGEPGARIFLYFDDQPLGEVTVGDDGSWTLGAEKRVEKGEHNFRADRLDEAGVVTGQASIGIVRLEAPKPPEEEVAAAPQPAPAPSEKALGEETAATEEEPAAAGGASSQEPRVRPKFHTVQRGDTLWDIAEEYYGGGWRYRAIVRENRRQIRDPHWIYPDQKFRLPAR